MRKLTKKGLIKKLDALVKELVLNRDKTCVTCPLWKELRNTHQGSPVLQAGHMITRGAKSVKWDLRNVHLQCRTCNFLHEHHPEVLNNYVRGVLGEDEYQQLIIDGNRPWPSIKLYDLENIYNDLVDNNISSWTGVN